MFPTKAALVLLLHAYIYLIARGQTMPEGVDCLDFADVALVVDVSGSIEGDGLLPGKFDQYVKPFLKQFCRGLKVGPGKVQIGMVTFGNFGTLEFGLKDDINEIIRNIDRFNYSSRGKNTNTSGGIYVTRTQLLSSSDPKYRKNAAHIAVVVTDGISTRDPDQTIPSAKAAQKEGIIVLACGVTNVLSLKELTGIASPLTPFDLLGLAKGIKNGVFVPSGTVAYVPEITDLVQVVNQLVVHFKIIVCTSTGNCPGGDRAEWCKNIPDSWCSNATVNANCCKTCGQGGECLDFADVALVVDVSGSIEGDGAFPGKFDEFVKPFLEAFSRGLTVGPGKVQIGMVTFGDYGTLEFGLNDDINEVIRNIDRFDYDLRGKNTNTSGGIYIMRTQLLNHNAPKYRPNAAHIAVVVTDGKSTWDHDLTIPSAKAAQKDGIIMLAVGVTKALNLTELIGIASPLAPYNISSLQSGIKNGVFTPSGTVAYVPEITDLIDVVTQLVTHFKKTVCNATGNCPGGDKAEWCKNIPDSLCSNATVNATCCKRCAEVILCDNYADLVFVVDVSGSIGKDRNDPEYFDRQMKPFLKKFVLRLAAGPGRIQVGLVSFGNYGYLQMTLKSDVDEILRGIDSIVYPANGENTNTSGGIYVMRTQVLGFNSPNYRPDATHLAIIVTDGQSTRDQEKTVPYADDAKNQGIIILSVGCTDSINVQELAAIASYRPGFNTSTIAKAVKNNITAFSGLVAYSPTIENLNSIVLQLAIYLSKTGCKQASVFRMCENEGTWCTSLHPGQCYDQTTETRCCRFCRERRKSNSNCRYGDAYSWCAPQYCKENSGKCCETCPNFECRNNADWCFRIFPGECYTKQTETTCCRRCRELLTGNPACLYGDLVRGCTQQQCLNSDAPRCCATCQVFDP